VRSAEKNRRDEQQARRAFAERLRALPGIKSVSRVYKSPLAGGPAKTGVMLEGQAAAGGLSSESNYNVVSPEYFGTVGLRVVRGRAFTQQEADAGAQVVVVSESSARRLWPGEDAIGKRIGVGAALVNEKSEDDERVFKDAASFPTFEVIGVARDTRSGFVWQRDETFLYMPLKPDSRLGEQILISTQSDAQSLMHAVRGEAAAAGLLISVSRLEDALAYQMSPFRAMATLAGALGLLALGLAGVGLYGVMSFVVSQRTREIGIRIALGAEPRNVVGMFLRQGARLLALGLLFGLLGGAAASRLLAAALVDIRSLDPVAFGGVSIFLAIVALLACYVPARRATKVDPMIALRYE
jgi:putative ABC transport system permease protein